MNKLLLSIVFILGLQTSLAQPLFLVTQEEMQESNKAPIRFTAKSAPEKDAPIIEVLTPVIAGAISSPTPIKMVFQANAPSNVKPDTFKVLYGTFEIDITKRITGKTPVTEQGLQVAQAELPKGRHKLLISVQDTNGRVGNKVIEFEIK
ncbi:MAG: hypothetical protein WCJ99_17275 [Betaproteobacteria bacterium]|jgi:hypothetical protein